MWRTFLVVLGLIVLLLAVYFLMLNSPQLTYHKEQHKQTRDQSLAAAEGWLSEELATKVKNGHFRAHWINQEDRFWYRQDMANGWQFTVVDAATGEQSPAFDHQAMASALRRAGVEVAEPYQLPIDKIVFKGHALEIQVVDGAAPDLNIQGRFSLPLLHELSKSPYRCDQQLSHCEAVARTQENTVAHGATPYFFQPEDLGPVELGNNTLSQSVVVQDYNLWLKDHQSGQIRQLTKNGEANFAYGAVDENMVDTGYVARRRAALAKTPQNVHWSPDNRYLIALRTDFRDTPERTIMLEFASGQDDFIVAHQRRMPIPTDRKVLHREITLIDLETGARFQPTIAAEDLQGWSPFFFAMNYLWWDLDNQQVYIMAGDKFGHRYGLLQLSLASGKTRMIVEEHEQHFVTFNGSLLFGGKPAVHVVTSSNELIWFSQRSGYGQLYRYDIASGELKNPITQGDWLVVELIHVDESAQTIYFTGAGREPGHNPYHNYLYRIDFDGNNLQLLTPENANHAFKTDAYSYVSKAGYFSPSGQYFIDTYSTLSEPPVTLLRRSDGSIVSEVVRADASALYASGWQPPEPFVVKAADGETDLYGVLYKPKNFDPDRRYAVIENTYPGIQDTFAPKDFMDGVGAMLGRDMQALAELGFITVALDGRGTSGRNQAFRHAFMGTEDLFGAADHKVALENLTQQYPAIDLQRVGVIGGSYGGYASLRAALLFPDFYRACVSLVGSHDFRSRPIPAGTEFILGSAPAESGEDIYHRLSNTTLAYRLQAKLLLIAGALDEHLHIDQIFRMSQALIDADKPFDMFIHPNSDHGVGATPYVRRLWWQYFLEHLGGPVDG